MTKFNHVMLKLETASTEYDAGILCISAIKFNMDTTTESEEFVVYINPESLKFFGLSVTKETLMWVKENRPEVWKSCRESDNDVETAMTLLSEFLSPSTVTDNEIWGNGIDFVFPVLKTSFHVAGLTLPYKFYKSRDLRTVLSLTGTNAKDFLDNSQSPLEICRQQICMLKHIVGKM